MAIGVDWGGAIPAGAIADAAYQSGLGEFIAKRNQQLLAQQQVAQQDQHFQQELAARLYSQGQSQLANQNSQLFHAQQQQAQNQFNKGFEYDRLNWQRENSQQDWDRNRQAHLEDLDAQRQWEVDKQPMVWGFQAATRSGEDLEKEIYTGLTNFAKQRPYMTPEGVNALNDLQSKFRAIQKVRDFARPEQYAQALGKFQADAARADIQQHINVPTSIEEQVKKEGKSFQEPIHAPDGTFMGYQVWTQTMRNGTPTLQPKFVPHRPDPQLAMMTATTPEQYWNTLKPSEQHAIYGAVSKEMQGDNTDAPAPDPEKVMAAVKSRIAAMRGMQAPKKEQPPPEPVDPRLAAAYEQMQQQMGVQYGQPGGQPVTPASNRAPSYRELVEQGKVAKPLTIHDIPADRRRVLQAALPHPKTPQEAMSLPPGTDFITPDGRLKTTPVASP